MYTQIGTCANCGAAIYDQEIWSGTTPPPPVYTCRCRPGTIQLVAYPNMDALPSSGYQTIRENKEGTDK